MQVRDYNSTGRWSAESVLDRYRSYAQQIGASLDKNLVPRKHTESGVTWIYPIMEAVIAAIERGDKACIAIGIEFIEEDQHFSVRTNPKIEYGKSTPSRGTLTGTGGESTGTRSSHAAGWIRPTRV